MILQGNPCKIGHRVLPKILAFIVSTMYLTSSSLTYGPASIHMPTLKIASDTPFVYAGHFCSNFLERPFSFFEEHDMQIATKADGRLVCILMPMNGNYRIRQQRVQYPLRSICWRILKSYAYRCLSLFRALCSNSLSKSLSIVCISISLCCEAG